ncbi:MAG: hypothetical protein RIR48_3011 [Bacteroidota bacterium]
MYIAEIQCFENYVFTIYIRKSMKKIRFMQAFITY